MATIGTFIANSKGEFTGVIKTLTLYRSTVLRHRFALMRPWASGRADRLGPGRVSCIHAAR
jgi:hypothetical protein